MATLSLCMIVKNEEDTLGRCLDSVRTATDQIVVVDTGSTDATVPIAKARNAEVFCYPWQDDFAAARNFSFSKATCEYILWLDADDVLEPEDLAKLIELKTRLAPPVREVAARYDAAFDEEDRPVLSYYRERIFLREAGFLWQGAVHETIPLTPDTLYADFAVRHRKIHPTESGRNLRIYLKLLASGKSLSQRERYYYARELYYNGLYPECIARLQEFLSGEGWTPDRIGACRILSECYRKTGDSESALWALFRSFCYGAPTPEVCCDIGGIFLETNDIQNAIYWYDKALNESAPTEPGAFVLPDCKTFLPLIQLCVCYDRLGDYEKAFELNERAALLKPNHPAILQNRRYFSERAQRSSVQHTL